jgi:hypothetical protein
MRSLILGIVAAAVTLGAQAPAAGAQTVWYAGPHPLDRKLLKGMCYIPGAHVHSYAPAVPLLYVRAGRHHAFVGDPVEHEIEAPRHAYYGHHPLHWVQGADGGHHYCYITGPHHHWYKPPKGHKYKHKGNVYWYVGGHPGWYRADHPRARLLRAHYHGIGVPLPEVRVAPPVGFVGAVVGAGWLTGHLLLRWQGGRWWGGGVGMARWHGHKWTRPGWKRGHWKNARWGRRWGKRRGWKRGGGRHGRRSGGRRSGMGGGVMHRGGK